MEYAVSAPATDDAARGRGAKRTSTLPYFRLDGGKVLLDCAGFSMEERGLYLSLMAIYWEGDCRLPSRERLMRQLYLRGQRAATVLDRVLGEFFPDGINAHLDQCREEALKASRRGSANARKGHEKHRQAGGISPTTNGGETDPYDF